MEVCAKLAKEGWKPWEAALVDPWWLINCHWYPEDKNGVPLPMAQDAPESISRKEAFYLSRRKMGLPEWQIDGLWADLNRKAKR